MTAQEKYQGKDIMELSKLFFEIGNHHLVPALQKHILKGLEILGTLDDKPSSIMIIADLDEKLFAFVCGTGESLESKDDDSVFYIAEDSQFTDCMELLQYIAFGNHPDGHLNIDSEVLHWVGDALMHLKDTPELKGSNLEIYANHYYGEAEEDPVYEGGE